MSGWNGGDIPLDCFCFLSEVGIPSQFGSDVSAGVVGVLRIGEVKGLVKCEHGAVKHLPPSGVKVQRGAEVTTWGAQNQCFVLHKRRFTVCYPFCLYIAV